MITLKKKKSVGKQLAELHLPPMKEQLPYETLEVLVNHENIWANLQGHNLTGSSFNLEDTDRWHPFIDHGEDGWVPPAPPRPFYSVGRIGPQLPPQRLSALKAQLFRAIKIAYADWRTTRSLRTRWASSLEPTLDAGLAVLEAAACSSQATDARAVDKWRGQLLSALPPDYHFVGRAFSFSVTTPELVVDHLMSKYVRSSIASHAHHTHRPRLHAFSISSRSRRPAALCHTDTTTTRMATRTPSSPSRSRALRTMARSRRAGSISACSTHMRGRRRRRIRRTEIS